MIRNDILLIKELIEKGYKDKHICMIVPCNQPYVSKIKSGMIQSHVKKEKDEEVTMDSRQKRRLDALNKILLLPELMTSTISEEDKRYIHLLKFLMVDKEEIYNLYFHISKKYFHKIWVSKKIDIRLFNSELIGIPIYDYLDLIIDFTN